MYTIEEIKRILIKSDFDEFKKALDDYDVHERDKFGNTISHYYLNTLKDLKLDFKQVFDELFERGIDIDDKQLKGPFKRSILHMAAIQNNSDLFDYLLSKNPDVDSVDANGNNILITAVNQYNKDVNIYGHYIKELLKRKANPNLVNNHGYSVIAVVKDTSNSDVGKFFEDKW